MAKFVNLAADLTQWNVLEARIQAAIELEDGLFRPLVNVFHFHKVGGSSQPALLDLANGLQSGVVSALSAVLNVRVTDILASIRPLDDPTVTEVTTNGTAGTGVITGDPLSASMAVVFRIGTGVRGRNFQGSKHFGGLSESDCTGGDELDSSRYTLWNVVATAMQSPLVDAGGNTYTMCVLSSTLSGINQSPPFFTGADVDSVTLNHILGTMRRRKERIPA